MIVNHIMKVNVYAMLDSKWISIEDELPPVNKRVKLSYGLIGIRGAVCDEWLSEGFLRSNDKWSILYTHNLSKNPMPTHWCYITY